MELDLPLSRSCSEISDVSLDVTTQTAEGIEEVAAIENRDETDGRYETIECSSATTLDNASTVSDVLDSPMDLSVQSNLQRYGNMDISVSSSGVMDVSHRSLTGLPRKFRKEYSKVRKLNLAGNRIRSLSQMDMFKQCTAVDASDNQISKLSSFLPLAKHLTALNVSNNAICNVDCLRSFVHLETFNASCNDILALHLLDNPVLRYIDLSSNSFTMLPRFSNLRNLKYLNLSSNKIISLKNAETFPESLVSFDISSNRISDLTEFMYLVQLEKLESIGAANNPCTSCTTFNYRPYIVSVLPSLREIDTFSILEKEQLLGEWLYSQGKGRHFKPGCNSHLLLVSYLEKHCPVEPSGKLLSSFDKSLRKAIEKRREILNTSRTDDDSSQSLSIHSPFRAWANKLVTGAEKSSRNASNILQTSDSSRREIVDQSVNISSNASQLYSETSSAFPSSSKSFSSVESLASSSTVTIVPTPTPRKSLSSKNSGAWNEQTQEQLRECIKEAERETNRAS